MTKVEFNKKYYPAIKETLYQVTLENGLTVSLLPKKDYKEIYGVVNVHVGSIDTEFTTPSKEFKAFPHGVAHFLEHKLFERENAGDIMAAFTALGAESNAFTSFTHTSYLFSATDHVIECLGLLKELVTKINISEESVEREKDIIEQEREMYLDDPDSCLFFRTLANLYPETPLAADIVGTEMSIQEISVSDLEENFRWFYTPVNTNIFLVGNFELEILKEYFLKNYRTSERFEKIVKNKVALHPVNKIDSIRMDVTSPKLAIGLRSNLNFDSKDCYRYSILLRALFTMMFGWTSQRYQNLYETGKIDSSLSLEIEVNKRFNFLMLTLETKEPLTLSHLFRKAIQEFEKDSDISEDHLDLVKSELYGEFIHNLNSLDFIATQYQPSEEGSTLFDLPKIIQEMSLEDVLEVGHHFIDNSDMVDFTILPL